MSLVIYGVFGCLTVSMCVSTYVVLVDEHVELAHGDAQVRLVELVRDVPADGAERAPLLDHSVEEAQAVQQLLERRLQQPQRQQIEICS